MNKTFADAFAAELASLTPVASAPTGSLGYGRDLSCVLDCTDDFAEVDGDSPLIIAQHVTRRFITPRGSVLDDPDQGRDVRGLLHRGVTREQLRQFESQLRSEALKDERVQDAEIQLGVSGDARTITVGVRLTPYDPALKPFSFVVSVTDAAVLLELLELQGGA